MIDLIVFDCDGVLVDSELIACRAVSMCLKESGIDLSVDEVIRSYMGLSFSTMINDLAVRFPGRLPANFTKELKVRTREAFDRDLKATEGVREVLSTIMVKTCVASSSAPERIRYSLSITGLLDLFGTRIFSATQVAHGKPAPDLFLFAADQMSANTENCLVIEDSIAGVQAARAAGMAVLGFTGGSHSQPGHSQQLIEAGALRTFGRMSQLLSILAGLS